MKIPKALNVGAYVTIDPQEDGFLDTINIPSVRVDLRTLTTLDILLEFTTADGNTRVQCMKLPKPYIMPPNNVFELVAIEERKFSGGVDEAFCFVPRDHTFYIYLAGFFDSAYEVAQLAGQIPDEIRHPLLAVMVKGEQMEAKMGKLRAETWRLKEQLHSATGVDYDRM